MKKIISLFIIIILFLTLFLGCSKQYSYVSPSLPKTAEELLSVKYFDVPSSASEICVIKRDKLNSGELQLVLSLMGIIAQNAAAIYISTGGQSDEILEVIKENTDLTFLYVDEYGKEWTAWSLIERYRSYINDNGYTLYTYTKDNAGINMSANIAAFDHYVSVSTDIEEQAIAKGLTKKRDLTGYSNRTKMQWEIFEEYKEVMNKKMLMHLSENDTNMRDFAIANRSFLFYTQEFRRDKKGNIISFLGKNLKSRKDKKLRTAVSSATNNDIPVFGWTEDEIAFVADVSKSGKYVIPMDHALNSSLLMSINLPSVKSGYAPTMPIEENNKHYLAMVMSDGDNIQWVQNNFSRFNERIKSDINAPITWTYPPYLSEIGTAVRALHYASAELNAPQDTFITGPSGIGYMNPSKYPFAGMDAFTDMTAAYMLKSDMNIVTILDKIPLSKRQELSFINKLDYFSRYDNIKGGILMLDPEMYASGKGKIYFSNEKAFASVRISLWNFETDRQKKNKWLQKQAEIINSLPRDYTSENGYTVVNIHAWSMQIEDIEYFLSFLDENVVCVSAEELIMLMNKHLPK